MKHLVTLFVTLFLASSLFGQRGELDLVQVSGLVMTGDSLMSIPYATVAVKGTSRGTYANYNGFFTIVAQRGETLQFSSLGYELKEYIIPDTIIGNSLTIVQLMTSDAINLPTTVIFPWPSRDHFKIEFLAMDVRNELEERAKENLAKRRMSVLRENMEMDGNENGDYYLRQQAQKYYYAGQEPPMQIFNAFAWAKFIQAWKNGDFKKKNNDE